MWLFTEGGFVSAVQHRENPDYLVVRARDKQSLQNLADICEVNITMKEISDYPYRVVVQRHAFAQWVNDQVDFLGYDNFKNRVAITRGKEYARTLGSVWSVMHDVEDEEARNRYAAYESSLGFEQV